ncbi:hypothetical protein AB7942_14900 [Neobacillus sp. BF23-41]|uniref:hypothetical protein n=1 Tax=Neobacillus sp. BF23-41 TaxID=3240280 RepID=UPI0034E4ED72
MVHLSPSEHKKNGQLFDLAIAIAVGLVPERPWGRFWWPEETSLRNQENYSSGICSCHREKVDVSDHEKTKSCPLGLTSAFNKERGTDLF